MEKHGKIELDLSEEQLQEITGGCSNCDFYQHMLDWSRDLKARYSWLAEANAARGNRQQARADAQTAAAQSYMSKNWQRSLDVSAATHGPGK